MAQGRLAFPLFILHWPGHRLRFQYLTYHPTTKWAELHGWLRADAYCRLQRTHGAPTSATKTFEDCTNEQSLNGDYCNCFYQNLRSNRELRNRAQSGQTSVELNGGNGGCGRRRPSSHFCSPLGWHLFFSPTRTFIRISTRKRCCRRRSGAWWA